MKDLHFNEEIAGQIGSAQQPKRHDPCDDRIGGYMGASELALETIGGVRVINLHRPDRHNAITPNMYVELGAAVDEALGDSAVRAIVLGGTGRSFCGGFDLQQSDEQTQEDIWVQWSTLQEQRAVLKRIFTSEKPTLCEAKGFCLGGGMSLLNQCDLVIAADDTVFGEPEVMYSLMPQPKLFFLAHPRHAKELMLLGEQFDAEHAQRIGLVNWVVQSGDVRARTLEIADRLARMPSETMVQTKRMMNAVFETWGYPVLDGWGWDAFLISKNVPTEARTSFLKIAREDGFTAAFRWMRERHAV